MCAHATEREGEEVIGYVATDELLVKGNGKATRRGEDTCHIATKHVTLWL